MISDCAISEFRFPIGGGISDSFDFRLRDFRVPISDWIWDFRFVVSRNAQSLFYTTKVPPPRVGLLTTRNSGEMLSVVIN